MKACSLIVMVVFLWHAKANFEILTKSENYSGNATCFTEEYGIGELYEDEPKNLTKPCAQASCDTEGGIILTRCDTLAPESKCGVIAGDSSEPYPDCCDRTVCSGEKEP